MSRLCKQPGCAAWAERGNSYCEHHYKTVLAPLIDARLAREQAEQEAQDYSTQQRTETGRHLRRYYLTEAATVAELRDWITEHLLPITERMDE
jgi:hypothetical protein